MSGFFMAFSLAVLHVAQGQFFLNMSMAKTLSSPLSHSITNSLLSFLYILIGSIAEKN